MKHTVAELEGARLDAAVALAEWPGRKIEIGEYNEGGTFCGVLDLDEPEYFGEFHPSTAWAEGGPIIERERIALRYGEDEYSEPDAMWYAECGVFWDIGPTPLIAAMRAFVASKFGGEVELP
jgi:hypothetical protein